MEGKQDLETPSQNHLQKERPPKCQNLQSIAERNDVAQTARLHTGHCSLNQYLYRFGIEESPTCECDSEVNETVDHYLTNCLKYDCQRHKLIKNVGVGGMWVEKLLAPV